MSKELSEPKLRFNPAFLPNNGYSDLECTIRNGWNEFFNNNKKNKNSVSSTMSCEYALNLNDADDEIRVI